MATMLEAIIIILLRVDQTEGAPCARGILVCVESEAEEKLKKESAGGRRGGVQYSMSNSGCRGSGWWFTFVSSSPAPWLAELHKLRRKSQHEKKNE
jgi:hypothetical protein